MNKLHTIISLVACLILSGCSNDEPDHEADLFSLAVQLEGEGELAMGIHDCEITVPGNQQYISIDIIGDYDYFRVTAVPDIGMVTSGDKQIKILLTNNLGETSQTGILEFTVYKGKGWNKGAVTITQRPLSSADPDEPEGVPDKYRFKLAYAGFTPIMNDNIHVPAPFDNISFQILDYLDRFSPMGFPEFVEPYDSIVWSSEGMPNTVRIYARKSGGSSSEEHFTAQWSSHFFKAGSVRSYLKGYREGKVIYTDQLRIETFERDFLCFNWTTGDVCIANPHAKGVYCGLDNSREYRVMPIREINGTKYGEIHVRNHKILPDDKFLSISRDVLIQLMRENIGDGKSIKDRIQSFNCVPEGVEGDLFWENETTRILLLHELPSDTALEEYYLLIEAK